MSEDRCRRDSGQDSDTLASDKRSFCLLALRSDLKHNMHFNANKSARMLCICWCAGLRVGMCKDRALSTGVLPTPTPTPTHVHCCSCLLAEDKPESSFTPDDT